MSAEKPLRVTQPRRISSIEAKSGVARRAAPRIPRFVRYAAIAAAILGIGVLGSWTHHAIERSLRELRAASLASVLDAESKALEVWIEERRLSARRLAQDVRLRESAASLARAAEEGSPATACHSKAAGRVAEVLEPFLRDEAVVAFHLVDAKGRVLAARPPGACGRMLEGEAFRERSAPAFAGQAHFVRPRRDTEGLVPARPGESAPPVLWYEAPVMDSAGTPVAVLALGEYADGGFAGILAAARTGRTGETIAFDATAMLLSESRFMGSALLTTDLRAPGGATAPRPLSRLAEEALSARGIAAGRGVLLEPYESYRGEKVIGAWRWLARYNMVVAVELAAEEAYAPLTFLNTAFATVFGLAMLAVAAAFGYAAWVRHKMGEARRLGAYVLERRIGVGGMADVYLAHHTMLRRSTAVKILRPEHADEQFVSRFEREVTLASQLRHPNTVEIYDYGRTEEGEFYYAMEYLDGVELFELIKGGPVPVARAVYLLRQVCAGLAEAHAKGLVHRDIKPENIMICRLGGEFDVVKILDFGLVKNVAEPHTRDLTRALKLLGTPLYMAPERFRNPADVDARADIYAVGAVAFYMLTGRELFAAADDLEMQQRVLNDEAPRPSAVGAQPIPIELDLLVTSCLEKRREDRPQRVTDLIEALDALAAQHRWTQREAADWWSRHEQRA